MICELSLCRSANGIQHPKMAFPPCNGYRLGLVTAHPLHQPGDRARAADGGRRGERFSGDRSKNRNCGLTQILTQNGKDRGGGNGVDSTPLSTILEQIVSNQTGKGRKTSLLPPGRIFTRRRSLVRVQQSPPRSPEIVRFQDFFFCIFSNKLRRIFAVFP